MNGLVIKTDNSIVVETESIIFPWATMKIGGIDHTIDAQINIKDIPEELKKGTGAEWLLRLMGSRCFYLNLDPPKPISKPEPKVSIWTRILNYVKTIR